MATTVTQPVLVYDRIAQNQRKSIFLVIIAILAIVPFVGGLSYGAAEYTIARFGHHVMSKAEEQRIYQLMTTREPGALRDEYDSEMDRELKQEFAKLQQAREDNDQLRWKVTTVFALAVLGVLGLLFWSLASSPVSSVLAMCGARPSGPPEAEARRLLENLAIGAGLPTPKLYVIDSPLPNAFAAGMDPSRSVVAVTQGLLTLLDHRELEGVLAHEISHIGNRDTRLNTVVTSIALFLRLPYLLRQKYLREQRAAGGDWNPIPSRFRAPYTIVMLPIFLYVFFVAPLVAAVIRAAISRSREYLADADAALLTRYPEGLLRALAKVGGCGSANSGANSVIAHLYFSDPARQGGLMSLLTGSLLATHPPIEHRIKRLMEFNGGVPISLLEEAARTGKAFAKNHPALTQLGMADTSGHDELGAFTSGSPMGRVFRILSASPIYDEPDMKSRVVARASAGDLLVVFDDPGKFRQVLTHDSTFGYMPNTIKMKRVDMMPAEIHDPAARAAAAEVHEQVQAVSAAAASGGGLTGTQLAITAGFGIVVFAGIFFALLKFGGS